MSVVLRMGDLYAPTLKEEPSEAEVASHRLLLRAGMMRKTAAGIYSFLPLGYRSVRKVEAIVREEMNAVGSQEVLLPIVQPAELWHESGRWDDYGPELARLTDRAGREFCLGPTHEEIITALVRGEVRSYRDLPLSLYQINMKFRDEVRPRFGLLRGREFIMKDAYSFHDGQASLQEHYDAMARAYGRVCERLGLEYRPVEADSGQIGGKVTIEFMALAASGEAALVYCDRCDYAANVEAASAVVARTPSSGVPAKMERVHTPGTRSIAEVAAFLGVGPADVVKTMAGVAKAADESRRLVLLCVPGDRELNPVKADGAVPGVRLLAEDEFAGFGIPKGFLGPVSAPTGAIVVADRSLESDSSWIVGANEHDWHLTGALPGRDFSVSTWEDLVTAEPGDACPHCPGTLMGARGIEVGQVFQLGTKYSESMGARFTDEDGAERPFVMGCYGIGITRALAAVIEQHHDDAGIRWPVSVAPVEVAVVPLGGGEVGETADRLAGELAHAGIECVIDDRDVRAGVKFADADLIGIPYQLVVGARGLAEGVVEVKIRSTGERTSLEVGRATREVASLVGSARAALEPRMGPFTES